MKPLLRMLAGVTAIAAPIVWATTGAAQTQADRPNFRSESALIRFLLPYAPVAFDFAVQAGRSFAAITYSSRGFDPVTGSFVVNDLTVRRAALDVTVRRFRVTPTTTLLQGVKVNTADLDLPPEVRAALARLGGDTVEGDVVIGFATDAARSAYRFDTRIDFPAVGSLAGVAEVDGFHVFVPVEQLAEGDMEGVPEVEGSLLRLSLAFDDRGLVDTVTALVAEAQGVSPDLFRSGVALMPLMTVGGLLDGLPGGASPQLREQALNWARIVESFLRTQGAIRVSFDPAEPVPLARLQTVIIDESLITALNPTVSQDFVSTPPAKPKDAVGAAVALITGEGDVPDPEAGALALLQMARAGDIDAVRALASATSGRLLPALGGKDGEALMSALLVARALGVDVADAALEQMSNRLGLDGVRRAETEAAAYFRAHTPEGKAAAIFPSDSGIRRFTPAALRGLAFDAYEGRGTTRDPTEAYVLASLAAAAGDPIALRLRDDLARAAHENRLAIAMPEARARAAALWAVYSGAPAP